MPDDDTEGISSFADAVAAARELAQAGDESDTDGDAPAVIDPADNADDQADSDADTDQPDVEAEADSVFGDVAAELREDTNVDPFAVTVEFEVDGEMRTQTVGELRDGYLRQADYTKKTQQLADERRAFEQESAAAKKLMDQLREDPAGTVAALAIELKLVDESAISAQRVADLNDIYRVPDRETVAAEIEERAKELASEAPEVIEARQAAEVAAIQKEFADIEEQFGVKFSDNDRVLMMEHAVDIGVGDLRLTYLDLVNRAEVARKAKDQATPQRPSVSSGDESADESAPTGPPSSFEEAVERARKVQATKS